MVSFIVSFIGLNGQWMPSIRYGLRPISSVPSKVLLQTHSQIADQCRVAAKHSSGFIRDPKLHARFIHRNYVFSDIAAIPCFEIVMHLYMRLALGHKQNRS